MGVALVLVVSMGAASAFQDRSADALEDRGGAIGAPDLDEPASTTATTSASPSAPDGSTTTSAPPTPPDSTVASVDADAHSNGKKWTATVVISITADGDPVHKAALQATWQQQPSGAVTPVSCTTAPNGTCTFTLRDLPTIGNSGHVASVLFTLVSVTPEGGTTSNPGLTTTVFEP